MTTPNEPATIREYIAARRKRLDYSSGPSAAYELDALISWLDAHEPKAVGEEIKGDADMVEFSHREDEMLCFKKGGKWFATLYARCPEDAADIESGLRAMMAEQKAVGDETEEENRIQALFLRAAGLLEQCYDPGPIPAETPTEMDEAVGDVLYQAMRIRKEGKTK